MNTCEVPWHLRIQNVRTVSLELNLLVQDAAIVGAATARKSNQKENG